MNNQTESLELGTMVRNVKTGTVFYFLGYRDGSDPADPVCHVESRRNGTRFGPVRYLKRSQIEIVGE